MNNKQILSLLNLTSTLPELPLLKTFDIDINKSSRICGTSIYLQVKFKQNKIEALGVQAKLCSFGKAIMGLLVKYVYNLKLQELFVISTALEEYIIESSKKNIALFKQNDHQFLEALTVIEDYPQRWQSALLFPHGLKDAIKPFMKKYE